MCLLFDQSVDVIREEVCDGLEHVSIATQHLCHLGRGSRLDLQYQTVFMPGFHLEKDVWGEASIAFHLNFTNSFFLGGGGGGGGGGKLGSLEGLDFMPH